MIGRGLRQHFHRRIQQSHLPNEPLLAQRAGGAFDAAGVRQIGRHDAPAEISHDLWIRNYREQLLMNLIT